MSHVSQQIRAWFVNTLSGVSGFPTASNGYPAQIAAGTEACVVTTTTEDLRGSTIHTPPIDERRLEVLVVLAGASLDAADALSVTAEETIANAASYPGKALDLVARAYSENVDTNRVAVTLVLTYAATSDVRRNDVETFL